MDWQIRLALVIIGLGVIGFIIYDFKRRKKAHKQTQQLIDQVKVAANQVDSLGFDINGVGSVRKTTDQRDKADQGQDADTIERQGGKQTIENSVIKQQSQESKHQSIQEDSNKGTEKTAKLAPTEQLDLADFAQQENHKTVSKNIQQMTSDVNSKELKSKGSTPKDLPSKDLPPKDLPAKENMTKEPASKDKSQDASLNEQVFALILQAPAEQTYLGNDFMPILLSQGLRHGDMGIFHRQLQHQVDPHQSGKRSKVLYSVANAINPGTFDIDNIENFTTPAFAFFMTVPGPDDPLMAYDAMVKTIKLLKQELGGQILDQSKSVFTEQTQQYQRESIQNHLIKSLVS